MHSDLKKFSFESNNACFSESFIDFKLIKTTKILWNEQTSLSLRGKVKYAGN